jgi:predicted transcriptional regulator
LLTAIQKFKKSVVEDIQNQFISFRLPSIYTIKVTTMKQMKHRSRSEIIGAILEAANGGGATKTTIMYKAVLSYEYMKEYLLSLVEDELVEYEQGRMTYRTTAKGMRLLQLYNNMNEMVQTANPRSVKKSNDLLFI